MLTISQLRRPGLVCASLTLSPGECVAVRGPSGAGKSLFLRAIADLDPNEGDVVLAGQSRDSLAGPQWRRLVGYLPAEPGWWADRIGSHFSDWAKAAPLAARLGLPAEAGDWPVTRPSTGERTRLALVRALAAEPKVLLLDEPTAALDVNSVLAVEDLIAERVAAGLAVLWVTHDPAQAGRVSRRSVIVSAGQVTDEAEENA
ncbi:MAG: ATP-binding cassette domain-containing protein [Telmatospirillum sp.]|nr:ATP-binding cassette domain-containing protein [Telmatospirillum sp.]